jgi:hypothetical protein
MNNTTSPENTPQEKTDLLLSQLLLALHNESTLLWMFHLVSEEQDRTDS